MIYDVFRAFVVYMPMSALLGMILGQQIATRTP